MGILDRFREQPEPGAAAPDHQQTPRETPPETTGRARVRLHGYLLSVDVRDESGTIALEARLDTPDTEYLLVWLGRRRIVGIEPGRGLTVYGRVAQKPTGPVILNPQYELDA